LRRVKIGGQPPLGLMLAYRRNPALPERAPISFQEQGVWVAGRRVGRFPIQTLPDQQVDPVAGRVTEREETVGPGEWVVGTAADAVLNALDGVCALARECLKQAFLGTEIVCDQSARHSCAARNRLDARAAIAV